MKRLSKKELLEYIDNLTTEQGNVTLSLRELVLANDINVDERIIEDKWLHGYIGYYSENNNLVYAIGALADGKTAFHMMPYYVNTGLQTKHAAALKKQMSGKSCINIKTPDALDTKALIDIMQDGAKTVDAAIAERR